MNTSSISVASSIIQALRQATCPIVRNLLCDSILAQYIAQAKVLDGVGLNTIESIIQALRQATDPGVRNLLCDSILAQNMAPQATVLDGLEFIDTDLLNYHVT